ncbi:MAG: c(7)-type cytochrome triheme domain-containing protein [Nitrospinota bacterium]
MLKAVCMNCFSGKRRTVLLTVFISCLFFIPRLLHAEYTFGRTIIGEKTPKRLSKRVPLTVFPHWIHSMWYTCKACHEKIFSMKREKSGSLDVMAKIENGESCGVCHNGKGAFGTKKNCIRCHQKAEPSREVRFSDPGSVSFEELDKIYKKLKIEWFPEKLKKRELIFDRTEKVDFDRLIFHEEVIRPKSFINKREVEEIRENVVVFRPKSDSMDVVSFDHTIHTRLISCSSCHEREFISKLGANSVFMKDIAAGKKCGLCHNGIAFSVDNCMKCHIKDAKKDKKKVLRR